MSLLCAMCRCWWRNTGRMNARLQSVLISVPPPPATVLYWSIPCSWQDVLPCNIILLICKIHCYIALLWLVLLVQFFDEISVFLFQLVVVIFSLLIEAFYNTQFLWKVTLQSVALRILVFNFSGCLLTTWEARTDLEIIIIIICKVI